VYTTIPTSNSAADAEGTNPNIAAAILRAAVTMRLTLFIFFFIFNITHTHIYTDK